MERNTRPAETFGHRIQAIDMFRGLAALAIVLVHVAYLPPNWQQASPAEYAVGVVLMPFSQMALAMFILMSGYCIHANTLRASPPDEIRCDWRRFWKRRFWRLYPAYLVIVLLSAGLTLALFLRAEIPFWAACVGTSKDAAAHVLMVHNLMPNYATGLYNGTLWTLAAEEQMYLLYIPFLWLRRQSLGLAVAVTFLVSAIGWQGWMLFAPAQLGTGAFHLGAWWWWPFQFWFLWVLGALAAEAHAGRIRLGAWCHNLRLGLVLVLLSLIPHPWIWQPLTGTPAVHLWLANLLHLSADHAPWLGWLTETLFYPCRPLAFLIFLNACIRYEARPLALSSRFCQGAIFLGLFSYSLYLIHMPVLVLFETFWHEQPLLWRFLLNVPVCLVAAWGYFRLVEQRFLLAGKSAPVPAAVSVTQTIPALQRRAA